MTPVDALSFATTVAGGIAAAAAGNPVDAARAAVDAALMLVPHEVAAQLLTDAAVRRANIAADAAERVKFGFPPDNG